MADGHVYDPFDRTTFDAIMFNAIGRSSEVGVVGPAYGLTHSTGNSGWSIGMIQTDLSSNNDHKKVVDQLLSNYQAWAPPGERFDANQIKSLTERLNTAGSDGKDLTAAEQTRLDGYLRSDDGRQFVGGLDRKEVDRAWDKVGQPLAQVPWLKELSARDPGQAAEIIGMTAKAFNQNQVYGRKMIEHLQTSPGETAQEASTWLRDTINNAPHHNSGHGAHDALSDASKAALLSGQANVKSGVELINGLELGNGRLSQAWQQEVHAKGNPSLNNGFNSSPDLQLFDGMLRDPAAGEKILAHVDGGAAARAVDIRGSSSLVRHEMARIEQDAHGVVVNGTDGNRYKMSAQGWEKNPPVLLNEKDHPGNALYKEAYAAVAKLDAQHHRKPDQQTEQIAAALAVAAREQGLKKIDHVVLSDDKTKAIAVEGGLKSHHRHLTTVDTVQASNTPLAQSSAQWLQVTPPAQSHAPAAQGHHHQNPGPAQHDTPAASGPGR